ncbi:hypothetical protein MN116_007694 [Schistosoma mekongi]|uniref:Myb/SANT-like DNA-binding domain-containing protein n=1 Tax=Schistosoma mekongi TaxID=38744 RepID=A0AAE2D286_SCHME|nr:hypothetical protein MN116_007694 [Schistosoma mekongi]
MAQFQPISLSQSVQLSSQQSVQQQQQQQQQQILQQNPCQYQLEPCDIKPQFSLIPSVSQTLTNNNMNVSQGGIGNVGALMTTLDNVVSGINNVTSGQFVTPMSHADVASLLMNPSKRAESFVIDEVKVMLKEIEARKHILLSLSPSTNRLKRRAWEEVAVCMANRWPHAPRRTADQVKKKWENLVSKTKRKVRAGHVTPELDWNETNAAVMQFLTQHSPPVRLRYLTSTTPSLLNLGNLQSVSSGITTASSASSNCTNVFNHTNNYGLSNSSFLDSYNSINNITTNNNINSSLFPNNQHSSLMLSTSKVNFLNSSLHQDNKTNSDNTTNNTGQQSFGNHESNDLNSFGEKHLNSSTEENDIEMISTTNVSNTGGPSGVGNITGSVHESFLSSFSPFNQSLINFGLPSTTESFYTTFSRDIQKELYLQLKQEHELRMDILRLQKQTWLLQMSLFKKMKVEQISSLFSSPSLVASTTSVASLINTVTTTSVTTPAVTNPITNIVSSSASSTCTTAVTSPNTTALTNETTSPSITSTSTSNTTSLSSHSTGCKANKSQCEAVLRRSLSPMFPQDGAGNNNPQDDLVNTERN